MAGLDEKVLSLLDITRRLNSSDDLHALLTFLAEQAAKLVHADRASIFLLSPDRTELVSSVALGSRKELRFDARLGIAGEAIVSESPILVKNAHEDPRFYRTIDEDLGYVTRSVLAVPLKTEEHGVVGVFEVLNKKSGKTFTQEDCDLLEILAGHATTAIVRTRRIERLENENAYLRTHRSGSGGTFQILGTSPQIQSIIRLIDTIHDTSVDVLIYGESGTGKELAARAIHARSPRAGGPFVAVNSAALPDELLEAELFGIEKGVATGVSERVGRFQQAHGGTLFLDEIGDLSLSAQAKILRVLQDRVVERLGSRDPLHVDVRVVAATNKRLENMIREGSFREDLYYRLKVVLIQMPSLREIREDIPLIANHFLERECRLLRRPAKKFSPTALKRLMKHDWPGNVRELENEVKRLVVSVRSNEIKATHLQLGESVGEPRRNGDDLPAATLPPGSGLKAKVAFLVEALEAQFVKEALEENDYNQAQTARSLGISRQGLINKLKKYNLVKPSRKRPDPQQKSGER